MYLSARALTVNQGKHVRFDLDLDQSGNHTIDIVRPSPSTSEARLREF